MVHSYGYRAGTRNLFSKRAKTQGMPNLTRYLTTFKAGDYVNVVGDSAIQKSLPHKVYHGKTGVVWNVTPRAVGVIVNKRHRQRVIPKRINVRIEHVRKAKCQDDLKKRIAENVALRKEGKRGKKRVPAGQPRPGAIIKKQAGGCIELRPEFFDPLKAYKV
ncbi:60S ribosomal protein L21 [Diplonema papillatum]|nr:60S ribosomal protein L21 [Diplonema papillatum]